MNEKEHTNSRTLSLNRKAEHDYYKKESFDAGMVLTGDEVKSIRNGGCNLKGSYATIKDGEVWLVGCNISKYDNSFDSKYDTKRERKLLLNRKEIRKIAKELDNVGVTLVVKRIFTERNLIKCELWIATGKHDYDKRQCAADRDAHRRIQEAMKNKLRH